MVKLDDIGGWPKVLVEEPDWVHDVLGPEHDHPDNQPCHIIHEHRHSTDTINIYAVMNIFVEFMNLGLYPPKWNLDVLAAGFKKNLSDPAPEMLAFQMGVTARGSGATSPWQEWKWWKEREPALVDMICLLAGFDISFTESARAVIEKHELPITEKRLMADFRKSYGDYQKFMRKNMEPIMSPFLLDPENGPKEFLSEFPARTARRIARKAPNKI